MLTMDSDTFANNSLNLRSGNIFINIIYFALNFEELIMTCMLSANCELCYMKKMDINFGNGRNMHPFDLH